MTTTKKRFSPVAFTAPTADEPIPVTTPTRPDPEPFKAPEAIVPNPRETEKANNRDVTVAQASDSEGPLAIATVGPELLDPVKPVLSEAEASIIQKLLTTRGREVKKKEEKVAFTWRISLDQADLLDRWAMDLRRKLGRGRLDRSELLAAIVDEVSDRPDVLDAVEARLHKP